MVGELSENRIRVELGVILRQGDDELPGLDALSLRPEPLELLLTFPCQVTPEVRSSSLVGSIEVLLPIPVADLIARFSEMRAKRTGVKPLMTTFSVYNLARNNEFDSSKAKRELDYRTRSYRETIHDEIKWLKASGKIA